jgi:hypothetical protein
MTLAQRISRSTCCGKQHFENGSILDAFSPLSSEDGSRSGWTARHPPTGSWAGSDLILRSFVAVAAQGGSNTDTLRVVLTQAANVHIIQKDFVQLR